jgi:D-tyrosyl-tRNA(Tyr) deacylase
LLRLLLGLGALQKAVSSEAASKTLQATSLQKMRAVIQRVSRAHVSVGEEVVGKIGPGLLVLLGVAKADTQADADYLANKILGLRIFEDQDGKMNLSLAETHGAVLAVSQFTLYGDVRKGRRPSFDQAAPPQMANELYEYLVRKIREAGITCETGRFQAMMQVELVNDGPVTILLDSNRTF